MYGYNVNPFEDMSGQPGNVFRRDDDTYVEWKYDATSKSVIFTLYGKLDKGDWIALGISDNKKMEDTDVKHVGIENDGTVIPSDRSVTVTLIIIE